jgi:hypothetical protein
MPPALDYISLDAYSDAYQTEANEAAAAKREYQKFFYPILEKHQRVFVVPGLFGQGINQCGAPPPLTPRNHPYTARTGSTSAVPPPPPLTPRKHPYTDRTGSTGAVLVGWTKHLHLLSAPVPMRFTMLVGLKPLHVLQ